jgi:dihydroxyacetone kinase
VVLLVNNLGATSDLEMNIVVREAINLLGTLSLLVVESFSESLFVRVICRVFI